MQDWEMADWNLQDLKMTDWNSTDWQCVFKLKKTKVKEGICHTVLALLTFTVDRK